MNNWEWSQKSDLQAMEIICECLELRNKRKSIIREIRKATPDEDMRRLTDFVVTYQNGCVDRVGYRARRHVENFWNKDFTIRAIAPCGGSTEIDKILAGLPLDYYLYANCNDAAEILNYRFFDFSVVGGWLRAATARNGGKFPYGIEMNVGGSTGFHKIPYRDLPSGAMIAESEPRLVASALDEWWDE